MTKMTFKDNFKPTASSEWSNSSGNWTAIKGVYAPTVPNNSPLTYTGLPFDFTNFTVTTVAVSVGDSGIFLRTDGTNKNGIVLVIGGEGYGQGQRGGGAGNSLYFSTIVDGSTSGPLDTVSGVFTPGQNYRIKVVVTGDTYKAYVNGVLKITFTSTLFSHGEVGLYGDQPNQTTGSGSGPTSGFSNFAVAGTLYAPPPVAAFAQAIASSRGQSGDTTVHSAHTNAPATLLLAAGR